MAENSSSMVLGIGGLLIGGAVTAAIAIATQGAKTSQANEQNLIDDLPAIVARLEILERVTANASDDLRDEISRVADDIQSIRSGTLTEATLDANLAALQERITALDGQVSRRFQEVAAQPIADLANDTRSNRDKIEEILQRLALIEALHK